MSKWNGKRFSVYTSDEKSALGLIKELGEQTNYNTDTLEEKTDKKGDHLGTWQGYTPEEVDISISSVVRLNTKELTNAKNDISTIKNDVSSLNSEKVGRNDLILSNQIANGVIDESKISDSLRQIIIGETPLHPTVADGSVTLRKVDFATNYLVYVNRPFDVSITGNGTTKVYTITFNSNTIWYAQSVGGIGWKHIPLVNITYNVENKKRLVLNTSTNEVILEDYSTQLNNNCILLLQNTEGYICGEFAHAIQTIPTTETHIPIYEETLKSKVVNNHVLKQGSNDFTIGIIADCQGNVDDGYNSYLHHYESLVRTTNKLGVDCLLDLGDAIMGNNTKEISTNILSKGSEILKKSNLPVFRVKGNHDDNSWIAQTQKNQLLRISESEWYSRVVKPFEKDYNLTNDENKGYYYKDFEKQKIRVITLDCEDMPYIVNSDGTVKYPQIYRFGYQQKQLQWLCEKALNFTNKEDRKEWGVVLISHQWRETIADDGKHFNDAQLIHILKAFKNGTRVQTSSPYEDMRVNIDYDFSSQGAMEIICAFGGDSHVDNSYLIGSSGIRCIEFLCSLPQAEPNMPSRTLKTESEDAWDIVSINRKERKIYCTRFGAGQDRIFSY